MEKNRLPPSNRVMHTGSTKSERLILDHSNSPGLGNRFSLQSKKSSPKPQLVVDHYDERKQWCEYAQMKIEEAIDIKKQDQADQMEASKQVQMAEQKLRQQKKKYRQLVNQRDAIDFRLKNEKGELQIMRLKTEAKFNADQQLWWKNKIKQCEQDLEGRIIWKKSKTDLISHMMLYISQSYACLVEEKYPTLSAIHPEQK